MSDGTGREVTIVAPYDSSVSAVVQEESVQTWVAQGWRVGHPESAAVEAAPAAPAPESAAVPANPFKTSTP